MQQEFFQWDKFSEKHGNVRFPVDAMGNIFLIDIQKDTLRLSQKCAQLLFEDDEEHIEISREAFEECLSEAGCYAFRQAVQRLQTGKAVQVSCHAAVMGKSGYLSSVIYLFRIEAYGMLFGHISVDYEPTREYDQHMEQIVQQLRHTQMINDLTVEGASDYVYQLDVVNNICTFSSKAMDVLPLDTPTFPDAMNRVLSFIVPEDRPIYLDSLTPFLTGQSDRQVAEYRVRTKQGNIMWISCRGKGIHDEMGRPIMIAGSLLDVTAQKEAEEKMQKMLYVDSLTGLKNRLCFEKDLEERLSAPGAKGTLLYMDIRNFKLYNELFGHQFGNRVLQEFAYMLNLYFSAAYGLYRFSGDEFLVHLKETDPEEVMRKLIPFQGVMQKTRELDGHSVYISTYTAIVRYPEHGDSVEELMQNANQCLYRMIREDKEKVSFFASGNKDSISQQFLIENEIRKDIENNFRHFRVVYQPIVRLKPDGSEWIGAEALLRYNNPAFPGLGQMELIRTLEYSGLILPVGRWVITQAVNECSKWNRMGSRSIVHVNIAAQQVSDAGLVQFIQKSCQEAGLMPEQLVVELTETSLLNNFEVANDFCMELIHLGIGVALDDFGTGYSSFNYLRQLSINEIKVDREYTRKLSTDRYYQTFISFLYQLSQEMKLQLCVEGVETEEELAMLREMGVSLIQGFYFERPMEADVICREFAGHMTGGNSIPHMIYAI